MEQPTEPGQENSLDSLELNTLGEELEQEDYFGTEGFNKRFA